MKKTGLIFLLFFHFQLLFPSIPVLILKFNNLSLDEKNNFMADLIQNSLLQVTVSDQVELPPRIDLDYFEKTMLKKLPDQAKALLVSCYVQKEQVYHLKPGLPLARKELLQKQLFQAALIDQLSLGSIQAKILKGKSFPEIIALARNKGIKYIISGNYFTQEDELCINYQVYAIELARFLITYEMKKKINKEIFDALDGAAFHVVKQLKFRQGSKEALLNQKSKRQISRQIAQFKKEFFLQMSFGIVYNGVFFAPFERSINRQIDIASPLNRHYHAVSPYFHFEFYQSKDAHFIGFGLRIIPPIFIIYQNFNINHLINLYLAYGFKKQYFFKWGLEFCLLKYHKMSRLVDSMISVLLLSFGLSFEFQFYSKLYPFFIQAGFSLYPPLIPYQANLQRNYRDRAFPFYININGALHHDNFIFPIIPRLGGGVLLSQDFGIFINYSLMILRTRYTTFAPAHNTPTRTIYLGDELVFENKIVLGIFYKNIIK